MRYISRRSLWKALLVGFVLLFLLQAYGIMEWQFETVMRVRAAERYPAAKIFLQEADQDYSIYLPSTTQPRRVELADIWTADQFRTPREAFLPDKGIRYYAKGYVNTSDAEIVSLRWTVNGPCGSKVLFDESGQINQGQWTLYQTDTAQNCPGVYTYTLRMAYRDVVVQETTSYVVNHPSEVVSLSQQGFDKCNIPYGSKAESISQMQTWWYSSPYYSINLYMGGVSRYCKNSELDAIWVNQVAKQGWSFIPTWVGPQAPCTTYRYRISSNPFTAYQEGIIEANLAYEKARELGFLGNTVIYYDMEKYSTTNLTCREAVNSFLAGWGQGLQVQGVRSGVYGHQINVNDWAQIAYPGTPNNVWIASWIRSYYDPHVSAYGIPGISDTLWYDHRIRQYAGDHVESYGGIAFSIDSNIMDGEVTVLPNPEIGVSGIVDGELATRSGAQTFNISSTLNRQVDDMQLLSLNNGWAIVNGRLVWTNNGGSEWVDITPLSASTGTIMAVGFIDESRGWAVSQNILSGEMDVLFTSTSGRNWDVSPLVPGNFDTGPMASAVYLDILDDQTGWVVVKLASSANFNIGRLFHTQDGGKNWEEYEIPFAGQIKFIDRERGWIAGGPAGNQLLYSVDGGRFWQELNLKASIQRDLEGVMIGLPEFKDERTAVLPIRYYQNGSTQVDLLVSHDSGISWQVSSAAVNGNAELSVSSMQAAESITNKLPEGAVKVESMGEGQGWVHVDRTHCSGIKISPQQPYSQNPGTFDCEKQSSILSTNDWGETWFDITP
jgi:photosystem II stability/assembly factor-like uncharacterized protein